MIEDTYVISILIGVGFDVSPSFVYLITWAHKSFAVWSTAASIDMATEAFLVILMAVSLVHLLLHLRTLRLSASYTRLNSVVRSACDNLIGDPGRGYSDHIFAYTYLGTHLFHFYMATLSLRCESVFWTSAGLAVIVGALFWSYTRIAGSTRDAQPSQRHDQASSKSVVTNNRAALLLSVNYA